MYEIDKEKFGKFLAELRKEKGYTQKDLSKKLLISDKAVSKWERGLSLPDITLLIPLSELLDVTVTELLECQRLERPEMDPDQVENLVKKALVLHEGDPEKKKQERVQRAERFFACAGAAVLELIFLWGIYGPMELAKGSIFLYEGLGLVFGAYFWLFIREKLPNYFDENRISAYSDGFFRMNLPGICFNNSNWPHIVRVGRLWTVLTITLLPICYLVFEQLFPGFWTSMAGQLGVLMVFLVMLFVPLYAAAKKYE